MAWDFSTDAEYAASLEWAREFVRDEIWPLDAVSCELDTAWSPVENRDLGQLASR